MFFFFLQETKCPKIVYDFWAHFLRCVLSPHQFPAHRFSHKIKKVYRLQIFQVGIPAGIQSTVINFSNALLQPQGAGMNEKYLRVLKDGFVSMDMAQNILVIKTVSGMAMAVAAAIDAMHWSEVAGCIAGDDTIMCAIRSAEDTLRVMDKIGRIAGRQ